MISFMVIGAPRSGTTWAANWLTTDSVHCIHDPLYHTHYEDWDKLECGVPLGVSCTGIWRWPDWVNSHPSKKVILHRDIGEVDESLVSIGLPAIGSADLGSIQGLHVNYLDLFEERAALEIWEYLIGPGFNRLRHQELRLIEMQPHFLGLSVGPDVTRRLRKELSCI